MNKAADKIRPEPKPFGDRIDDKAYDVSETNSNSNSKYRGTKSFQNFDAIRNFDAKFQFEKQTWSQTLKNFPLRIGKKIDFG